MIGENEFNRSIERLILKDRSETVPEKALCNGLNELPKLVSWVYWSTVFKMVEGEAFIVKLNASFGISEKAICLLNKKDSVTYSRLVKKHS